MYCTNCGKKLSSENKFCQECGAKTKTAAIPKADNSPACAGVEEKPPQEKSFKKYKKVLCPNCGYQGLAGVTEEWVEPYCSRLSFALVAAVPILLLIKYREDVHLAVFLVVSGLFFSVLFYFNRCYKICPICKCKVE